MLILFSGTETQFITSRIFHSIGMGLQSTVEGIITFTMGLQSTTEGLLSSGLGINELQTILNQCGSYLHAIQFLLNKISLGDPFNSVNLHINSLSADIQNVQNLIISLPTSKQTVQSIRNIIIGDIVKSVNLLVNEIKETSAIGGLQLLQGYIGEYSALFEAVSYSIYLDGRNITKSVTNCTINYDESSIHNSIDIASSDRNLFFLAEPFDLQGESRIEVHVGNRILYFLYERKSGTERAYTMWGRSLSAREDMPFAEEIVYTLTEPKSAKEVAESLPVYSSVSWLCDDWVLPASFEFRGTPLEGLSRIAGVIDAVVRCKDDGTIEIRDKFKYRPVDLNEAPSDLSFSRDTIIEGLSYSENQGTRYNQIEVYGADNTNKANPELELVEENPLQGTDVNVRVYWNNMEPPPNDAVTTAVTDGNIVISGIQTRKIEEKVTFNRGVSNSQYPISELSSYSWIGKDLGNISSSLYNKELTVDTENDTYGFGLANITYMTKYQVYTVRNSNVSELLFILLHSLGNNVNVIIKSLGVTEIEIYEAQTISDPLLTDKNAAIKRGLNWLDANKYNSKTFNIRIPYRNTMLDGITVFLNDGEIGCSGNFKVTKASIVFSGPKVVDEVEVIQWQV